MISYGRPRGGSVTDPAAGEWFDTYNPCTRGARATDRARDGGGHRGRGRAARAASEGWATTSRRHEASFSCGSPS